MKIAAKLDLVTQDELNKLENPDNKYQPDFIADILERFGIEQQAIVLNHLQGISNGKLNFQKYRKLGEKKLELFDSSPELADHIVNVLLQEKGIASVLVSKEELVEMTVKQLTAQFAYSNENQPPSVDGSTDHDARLFLPGFMKPYIRNRLPVFVENALQAISMKKDREYMIYEDRDRMGEGSSPNAEDHHFHRIIPVDFKVRHWHEIPPPLE